MEDSDKIIKSLQELDESIFAYATVKKGETIKTLCAADMSKATKAIIANLLYEALKVVRSAKKTINELGNRVEYLHEAVDAKEDVRGPVELDIKSVAAEIKKEILENVIPDVVKNVVKEQNKKWSDLFDKNNTAMKIQTNEARNQTKAVEKSIIAAKNQQAVENIERQKRQRNICIQNIPEPSQSNATEKQGEDTKFMIDNLGLKSGDIERVFRAGPVRDDKKPRALIAVMVSPEIAKRAHNYGRGNPIRNDKGEIEYWVNPDLIKSDREANYKARIARRSAGKGMYKEVTQKETDEHLGEQRNSDF